MKPGMIGDTEGEHDGRKNGTRAPSGKTIRFKAEEVIIKEGERLCPLPDAGYAG